MRKYWIYYVYPATPLVRGAPWGTAYAVMPCDVCANGGRHELGDFDYDQQCISRGVAHEMLIVR